MKAIYTAINKASVEVDVLGHPGEGWPRGVTRIKLPSGEEVNVWKTHLVNKLTPAQAERAAGRVWVK